jgi:hypothetical protein
MISGCCRVVEMVLKKMVRDIQSLSIFIRDTTRKQYLNYMRRIIANKVNRVTGGPFIIFDDLVELLYISNPIQVMLLLELRLRINKNQRMIINMKNHIFTQYIMVPSF